MLDLNTQLSGLSVSQSSSNPDDTTAPTPKIPPELQSDYDWAKFIWQAEDNIYKQTCDVMAARLSAKLDKAEVGTSLKSCIHVASRVLKVIDHKPHSRLPSELQSCLNRALFGVMKSPAASTRLEKRASEVIEKAAQHKVILMNTTDADGHTLFDLCITHRKVAFVEALLNVQAEQWSGLDMPTIRDYGASVDLCPELRVLSEKIHQKSLNVQLLRELESATCLAQDNPNVKSLLNQGAYLEDDNWARLAVAHQLVPLIGSSDGVEKFARNSSDNPYDAQKLIQTALDYKLWKEASERKLESKIEEIIGTIDKDMLQDKLNADLAGLLKNPPKFIQQQKRLRRLLNQGAYVQPDPAESMVTRSMRNAKLAKFISTADGIENFARKSSIDLDEAIECMILSFDNWTPGAPERQKLESRVEAILLSNTPH